jgi:hypothetical protein
MNGNMKYLKEYTDVEPIKTYYEITYSQFHIKNNKLSIITDKEYEVIKKLLCTMDQEIKVFQRNNLHFHIARYNNIGISQRIFVEKDMDDWYYVRVHQDNSTNSYRCDQMYGLRDCISMINATYLT